MHTIHAACGAGVQVIAAVDGTLGFARGQFNEAAQVYNNAAMQFPTWVVAGNFGFRAAGVL